MAELWVPIIGTGKDEDPYRADVPPDVPWVTDNGVPCDLGPDSPTYGRPVNAHMLIRVAEKDAARVKTALPPEQVPAEERALVDCVRIQARPGAVTAAEEALIAERVAALEPAARSRVLAQMVLRGLRPEAVEAVR